MKIYTLTNRIIPIRDVLQKEMQDSIHFSIASAFIDDFAIDMLENVLSKNKSAKEIKVLIGIYGCFNSKSALVRLKQLAKKYASILQIHISKNKLFHWKYFHFKTIRKQSVYVGSANFTSGGLGGNGEVLIKISDSGIDQNLEFANILKEFDKEWKRSGPISKFQLKEYQELKPLKTQTEKGHLGNEMFFSDNHNDKPQIHSTVKDNHVVIYLDQDLSVKTLKMIHNHNPDWHTEEYFICTNKRMYDQCRTIKRFLIIDKINRMEFHIVWASFKEEQILDTPDGKYFISYLIDKRKKLTPKLFTELSDTAGEWKFNLNGRKNVLEFKVLRNKQIQKLRRLLN